jgi:hypothetical protein
MLLDMIGGRVPATEYDRRQGATEKRQRQESGDRAQGNSAET